VLWLCSDACSFSTFYLVEEWFGDDLFRAQIDEVCEKIQGQKTPTEGAWKGGGGDRNPR